MPKGGGLSASHAGRLLVSGGPQQSDRLPLPVREPSSKESFAGGAIEPIQAKGKAEEAFPQRAILHCSGASPWQFEWRFVRTARDVASEPASDRVVRMQRCVFASVEEVVDSQDNSRQPLFIIRGATERSGPIVAKWKALSILGRASAEGL
jgi:hypothetical protein